MTLDEFLRDESRRQQEFPVCRQKIFLAHAGVSPLPGRVAAAMQQYLAAAARDNQEDALSEKVVDDTRALAAELLGADAAEIAFVGSTSMGLALVATGLAWRPGQNLVCHRDDYPANVYPWIDLRARGVEVRLVEPRQYGNVTVADLDRVVDRNTRLVALASVHFLSGWRLAVDAVGRFLQERGILFCLDGIQSFGALRTAVRFVDFAAADSHKWLLGPLGAGLLYVRRERFAELHPALVGWRNASCPDFVAQENLQLWSTARRYEPGSLNLVGIVGLAAGLRLIREWGIEAVEARVLALACRVIREVQRQGFDVLGPVGGDGLSGIVSFSAAGRDVGELYARLLRERIVISLRRRRDGRHWLRASPHFYNTDAEIDRLLEALAK